MRNKRFILILAVCLSLVFIAAHSNKLSENRPNFIIINIDDLGWTDLSFMGSQYYETPHIDELATEGMVFSRAYAAASNCAPSRAALFSGQYAPRTGIYTVANSDRGSAEERKLIPIENRLYLDEENLTFAELLQNHGYRTAHVGKWHITKDPMENGFDVNIGGFEAGNPAAQGMGGYFSPYHNPNLEEGPEGEYLTDRLTDEAIVFLETAEGQPFFLNYAPYTVHTPIQPKPELEEKYTSKPGSDRHDNPGYAAMIESMDTNIGRLISFLKTSGLYENTLLIFTSDNGGLHEISRQWPLRAGKGSYFEGGIRVPMIAVWPGVIDPGTASQQPVSQIDLYPTLLEAAGISNPEEKPLDGLSLIPVFKGDSLPDRSLFWHFPIYLQAYSDHNPDTHDRYFRTRPGSVILKYPWKLHEYFEDGRLELYNLELDIREETNLIEQFPSRANELHEQLKSWRDELGAPVPGSLNPEYKNMSDEN
ncbi:sulfatase [Rhodohalobacter sulfatireducens]|uniref:Sulfatase n=1 Tax=Rhodohalobacter sulfatireducens TaxID=2911366 RepID=A0ABS9KHV6_9BACT|nr:sulfatase [Rhodohalobacter sulfatireducens]MCG2590439.1 sulfatase [Rhodohalobacter sulfatireducens]